MKEYYIVSKYAKDMIKEEKEVELLNIYANLYAQYVDDDEAHIYQHIYNNRIDIAPVNELEQHILMLKEHIRFMMNGENNE